MNGKAVLGGIGLAVLLGSCAQQAAPVERVSAMTGGVKCVLTQGYWKNHPAKWHAATGGAILPGDRFYHNTRSFLEVMKMPSNDREAYYQLAQQYVAAKLNGLHNYLPPEGPLREAFLGAFRYFEELGTSTRAQRITWNETLTSFNEGRLGFPSCADD